MIALNLDASETRPNRMPAAKSGSSMNLKVVLFGLVGASALVGFGVAASTVLAGLAAPAPVKIVSSGKAADWPELKDGLPVIAGSVPAAPAPPKPAQPETPALRMASLPEAFTPIAAPAETTAAPKPVASKPAKVSAAPVPPTQRIPVPTSVTPVATTREVAPLVPTRTAALQTPRASETVRARELVDAAIPSPASDKPARVEKVERSEKAERSEKSGRTEKAAAKTAATRKAAAPARAIDKPKGATPATVAQAEPAEAEDTEVLGIKIPSLAPAGRKLKESVDALGDAVKNVF